MRRNKGFTLIELIITLMVAATLMAAAVPSFTTTIMNNRRLSQINELVGALTLARSEAVKRKTAISLCKSSDGNSCSGTGWEDGWIIFANDNDDNDRDSGEEILRVYAKLPDGNTLRGNGNISNYLSYRPDGFSNTNGTFTLCDSRGAVQARGVVISMTGRARIKSDSLACP